MTLIVIPARMNSRRFPGKALASINGQPMLQRVIHAALESELASRVIVASDSPQLLELAERCGVRGLLVDDPKIQTGTDRVAAAVKLLRARVSVIVNLQGDEPQITGQDIDALIDAHLSGQFSMTTAGYRDPSGPHCAGDVHMAVRPDGKHWRAHYFTRSRLPNPWRHVGVYAFRSAVLTRFAARDRSENERQENLEQLRLLDDGGTVQLVDLGRVVRGVNRPSDLQRVEGRTPCSPVAI